MSPISRAIAVILAVCLAVAAVSAARVSRTAPAAPGSAGAGATPSTPSLQGKPGMAGMAGMPGMDGEDAADGAMAHEAMEMGLHMKMTAPRPRTAADQRRADAIVQTLRGAIGKYRDYHLAVADHFIQFLPHVRQPLYHFTNYRNALEVGFRFDPAQPTSLLYKPTASGFELVGAMYTAPRRFTEDQLDARVPLSVASWHQHTNLCLPPRSAYATADWHKFGLNGSLATEKDCLANGGTFRPVVLGWMVHVYPFENDPAKIWAH
jgi:hypothetical protein